MKAIVVQEVGGPEVLRAEEVAMPEPAAGQVRVKVAAAGVNFIDVYDRKGIYPVKPPFIPGREAAGVVDAVGPGVSELRVGDRVAFPHETSAYAEAVVAPWERVVRLPDAVELPVAAAAMLQGLTAHYLSHSTFPLGPGHTALVLAAAGGVGHLLVQMAKKLGARVIGTASNAEKAELARSAGADDVILYREANLAEEARRLTGGTGVDVVYDSVGQDTFDKSLDTLRVRGMMVLYGQSSGSVAPLDPQVLNRKGSLFLTRPSLAFHMRDRNELLWRVGDVLGWIQSGELEVRVDRTYPLQEAAEAHRYLEAGLTKGKVLLLP